MENEVTEVLMEEELNNEVGKANHKTSKKIMIAGIIASVAALMFKFRKKINNRIEGSMVRKLTKKGYIVHTPTELEVLSEDINETLLG